jgi:hypothetical protein
MVLHRVPKQSSWAAQAVADEHAISASCPDAPVVSQAVSPPNGDVVDSAPTMFVHPQLDVDVCTDNDGPPVQPTDDGPSTPVHGVDTPPSVQDFIAGLRLPLEVPLIQSPPRLRVSRMQDENWVPRRSERLVSMSAFRDPNPEKQAKRVLLSKWQPSASALRSAPTTPDATIAARFHETFREPLSSSKREALQELYPLIGARGRRHMHLD